MAKPPRPNYGERVPVPPPKHESQLGGPSAQHVSRAQQASCSARCGGILASCSCRATCENLGICCPDYWMFCVQISPSSGTLLGGKDFTVLNVTLETGVPVTCRFAGATQTRGYVGQDGQLHCVSPLLYEIGLVSLEISLDGGKTFPWSGTWTSVHHNKVPLSEKSMLINETKWQYYGTPGTGGHLAVIWNSHVLPSSHVHLEVWGYHETGKPYSDNWTAEWKYLYSLERNYPNHGHFAFLPAPSAQHGGWEMGALRISANGSLEGQPNVAAIWSTEHALAWHLEEAFRMNSAAWAAAKCQQWDRKEADLPNFLEEIPDCPCTLAQARADSGRFHTDYGCDIEKGSVCTYHPGAVHCVRSVQASPRYAAGQQCCYNASGAQMLTGDSMGGSTPDRGHDWGAPPYKKPPRIPGFSHWLYDVLSFYYCCLWSHHCDVYFKHRPSSGCQRYRPPRVAAAFGDPHFLTFDGLNFTFKGLGEYLVLGSKRTSLSVQGRTRRARLLNGEPGAEAKVTGFSAIAMREKNSDVVEVRLPGHSRHWEVLLNQKALNFSEQTWMDLKGLFLYSSPGQSVMAMFSSGAGLEVRGHGGKMLSLTALLPETFLNQTEGLFGLMNGQWQDDLTLPNGTALDVASSGPREHFAFGADWAITNETSLFTYDTQDLLHDFVHGPKHNSSFVPVFSPPEDADASLLQQAAALCNTDTFCRFDVLTTGDLAVGNITRLSLHRFRNLQYNLRPVVSCSWLPPPSNGVKDGTHYLAGSEVRFRCHPGYRLLGLAVTRCQVDGTWTGHTPNCIPNGDLILTAGLIVAETFCGKRALWTEAQRGQAVHPRS
ncbi:sushi domain-containing protein 2 [Protobothrops mucrosquamatus]|uniref:sushi domain-containing protein 2 n=1 Tax=Protobothrops mucrosquamatus TaxID=103944 RepID=UPI0010FB8BE5|nr:sushi domain-containing protein 2 [Protobothrops mucrosquamatus]